jgi:GxxExxY protein
MPYEGEIPPSGEPSPEVDRWARAAIGAAIEVHRHLGPGLDEESYCNSLAIEFGMRDIPFEREVRLKVIYKGHAVGTKRMDFVIAGVLLIEVKAIEEIGKVHKAQVNTYLKLTGYELGLLINFNTAVLKDGIKRVLRL